MPFLAKVVALLRKSGGPILVEVVINLIAPLILYDLAVHRLGEVGALMVSSIPPILWSLIEFARRRRVDAISVLVLGGIALSLVLYLGGGSAHLLQLREKLVTALIGGAFLVSALIGRPLIYELARASMKRKPGSQEDLAEFERLKDNVYFKRVMRVMTLVWGFGLIADAGVSALLVLRLPVRDYLVVGPIFGYGVLGLLSLWTFLYVRRARRLGAQRRAAALAVSNPEV